MNATRTRRRILIGLTCAGAALVAVVANDGVPANEPPVLADGAPPEAAPVVVVVPKRAAYQQPVGGDILIQADRQTIRRLRMAQKLIKDKQYLDAVGLLQRVLDRDKDAFYYPDPEKRDVLQSVRGAAEQLIAGMPKGGRDAYHLKFGAAAKILVEDAVKDGRIDALKDVARRYFHTPAGNEAMYRLGTYYWDLGQPLAAGLCFERLRVLPRAGDWEPLLSLRAAACWNRAGLPRKTRQALAAFLKHNGDNAVTLGGKTVRPFQKSDDGPAWLAKNFAGGRRAVTGLDEWLVFRGNRQRNGIAPLPTKPADATWRRTTIVDPLEPTADVAEKVDTENLKLLKSVVKSLDAANQRLKAPLPPRVHPLVIDGTILVRTLDFVRAIELETGSWLWDATPDSALTVALSTNGKAPPSSPTNQVSLLARQRLFADLTWGVLSTDGRRVYAVQETGVPYPTYDPKTRQRFNPKAYNRLMAYDLKSGRQMWAMGGPGNARFIVDAQAGRFFLSAPLPLAGHLYCLAEVSGEIRLLAFDQRSPGPGQSPELLWSQPLVGAGVPIARDWSRRQGGASVSYADGVMVCNTDAGFVIGVNLTSRSLLWAYRYRQRNVRPFPGPFPRPQPPPRGRTEWFDHAAVIADGKVLLTPRGSAELHCLNLVDGSVAWKKPQADGLYVAGVVDGKVLLVGSNTVQALGLKDGKTAWKKSTPGTETPSGVGIIAGSRLFIPTLTEGVAAYDAATGKLLGKQKLPKDRRPGNLVIAGGSMISQGVDGVDVFPVPLFKAANAAKSP
ncbi:MAG: PQQ-binding-like beta-propeller repeat protein [Planctomycetaceae bacterium]